MSTSTDALAEAGVAIWLDDLSRERIESGNLAELIENKGVVGVTTNPSIFQAALTEEAHELAVPMPVSSASLVACFASRQQSSHPLQAVATQGSHFGGQGS